MDNGVILIDQGTKINNFWVSKHYLGSMYYSENEKNVQLKIMDSFITCNTTANWTEA
jgi:hypothetical protein